MAGQHMPGPWQVGFHAMDVVAPSKKGGHAKVCDIRGWGYLTGKGHGALGLTEEEGYAIQQANAALIAAAPDLLEAAKEARQILDAIAGMRGDPEDGSTADKLRRAIARAEAA